ncbi:membrane-associated protein, putative [Bodo saltans]|uniref:Membrane-associated protein, putative n=1 Tax=Bodo saltans TaxID=75058 RepID=A0A0S4J4S0_BODSA|nr:membrane-associated protein, putative [Bodo saltans]|eukprot:CUG78401.1 membrane-associated protein, putative [Bodo saltans]
MSTRNIALCDANSAIGGGLIDLGFVICSKRLDATGAASKVARSAVVSNAVILVIACCLMTLLALLWSVATKVSLTEGLCVFCLPSSLLPILFAVVPSSSSAATFLVGGIGTSPCSTIDAVLALVGYVMCLTPVTATTLVWWVCVRSKGRDTHDVSQWRCVKRETEKSKSIAPSSSLSFRARAMILYERCTERTHKWERNTDAFRGDEHKTMYRNGNVAFRMEHAWVVLLEYRVVWYCGIDSLLLAVVACASVVGGLSSSTLVCHVFTVLSCVLLISQFILVTMARPFTTLFGFIFAAATIALTTLSVIFQMIFIFTSREESSGMWLVTASAMCNLVTFGVSGAKAVIDVLQLTKSVARRQRAFVAQRRRIRNLAKLSSISLGKAADAQGDNFSDVLGMTINLSNENHLAPEDLVLDDFDGMNNEIDIASWSEATLADDIKEIGANVPSERRKRVETDYTSSLGLPSALLAPGPVANVQNQDLLSIYATLDD